MYWRMQRFRWPESQLLAAVRTRPSRGSSSTRIMLHSLQLGRDRASGSSPRQRADVDRAITAALHACPVLGASGIEKEELVFTRMA